MTSSGAVVLTALAIGGTPITALAILAILGAASPGGALAAIIAIAAAAFGLALVWARDLDLLTSIVRKSASPGTTEPLLLEAVPVIPAIDRLGRDVERLSREMAARDSLIENLRRTDATIVELLPDPVIVLAADRTLLRANAAARAAFGDDLPAVLRHPDLRAAIDRAAAQALSGQPRANEPHTAQPRTAQTAELIVPVPVPRELHGAVTAIDPPLADGGVILAVLSDRTRERTAERTRADFVANASHELRTPLASLSGFIETLLGPAADDPLAQRRFLGIMAEQADRMSRLIDDLLNLSRVELVEHQAPAGKVDLAVVASRIIAAFEPRVAKRAQKLSLSFDPSLPPIIGDSDQMAQILQNLLDNSVKYGRDGGSIVLKGERAPAGTRWPARPGVLLSVTDDGIGIPRQHLPRLTERFYRVDKSRSRTVEGTGLGLAIVKHIVNRHRGQLVFDSEEGKGTSVFVWLPLTVPAAGNKAGPSRSA